MLQTLQQIFGLYLCYRASNRLTNYPHLFCHETLHVWGIFFAHLQEFCTVHSALVRFMQVLITASILTLLGSGHQNLHEPYQCRMYSTELLMMGKEARNM